MSISQIVDKFKANINLAKAYQGGIVLVKAGTIRETKKEVTKEVDIKESYFGTAQSFFINEIINEFAHAVDDDIYYRSFTLVEDDGSTAVVDYLKHGEVPVKRINDVVLMCLPLAEKYLKAKYKFIITDTKLDERIMKTLSELGIVIC